MKAVSHGFGKKKLCKDLQSHGVAAPERWWFGFMQMWINMPQCKFSICHLQGFLCHLAKLLHGWDWIRNEDIKKKKQIVAHPPSLVGRSSEKCLKAKGLTYCHQFSSNVTPVMQWCLFSSLKIVNDIDGSLWSTFPQKDRGGLQDHSVIIFRREHHFELPVKLSSAS